MKLHFFIVVILCCYVCSNCFFSKEKHGKRPRIHNIDKETGPAHTELRRREVLHDSKHILKDVLKYMDEHNLRQCREITIAFATEHYDNIAMNWLLHLYHQRIHCHILFGTQLLQDSLQLHGFKVLVAPMLKGGDLSVLYKTRYETVLALLISGRDVHLSDVDAIPCSDIFDALKHYPAHDFAGGNGIYPSAASFQSLTQHSIGSLNAGFLVIRNTTTAVDLVISTLLQEPTVILKKLFWDDQVSLNSALMLQFEAGNTSFVALEDGSFFVSSVRASFSNVSREEASAAGPRVIYLSRHRYPVSGYSWTDNVLPMYCGTHNLAQSAAHPVVMHPSLVLKTLSSKSSVLEKLGVWVFDAFNNSEPTGTRAQVNLEDGWPNSNVAFANSCASKHFCNADWKIDHCDQQCKKQRQKKRRKKWFFGWF